MNFLESGIGHLANQFEREGVQLKNGLTPNVRRRSVILAGMKTIHAFLVGVILGATFGGLVATLVTKHYAIDEYRKDIGAAIKAATGP